MRKKGFTLVELLAAIVLLGIIIAIAVPKYNKYIAKSKKNTFRETLSDGWLTSEILTETLSKFTGDLTDEQLGKIADILK